MMALEEDEDEEEDEQGRQTTDERTRCCRIIHRRSRRRSEDDRIEWMMIGLKGKWAAGTLVSLSSLCTLPVNILSYQHDPGRDGWMGVAVVISKLSLL